MKTISEAGLFKDSLKESTLTLIFLALFLMIIYIVKGGLFFPNIFSTPSFEKENIRQDPPIYIQIEGKGVYTFPSKKAVTLKEVIDRSGLEYSTSTIKNWNTKLETGSKISIGPGMSISVSPMDGEKLLLFHLPIDINRATSEDLEALPGIGEKLAQRIVKSRDEYGVFQSVDDLKRVKEIVESTTKEDIQLIAKIEHQDSLDSINEIASFSNGLMVARGDLAIEVGPARVPVLQKQLIQLSMRFAKPVIVATQMLESMTKESLPTRAEASDVSHAVFDGADALMLSAETATGRHPLQVMKIMKDIILEAEKNLALDRPLLVDTEVNIGKEIGISAVKLAKRMSVKAIIALTQTGYTASMVSRNRESLPIYAVSHNQFTKRVTRLYWGVKPIFHKYEDNYDELVLNVIKELHKDKYIDAKDNVVLVAGSMVGISGKTHTIQLLNVEETLTNEN